jgi:hypothetical protein
MAGGPGSLGGTLSAAGSCGTRVARVWTDQLGDQGMQIYTEEGNERPEHNRREAFQNVAGNVPCNEVRVSTCDQ